MSAAHTVYNHPDGFTLAFNDNALTATDDDGKSVSLAGASNSPELVAELRRRGLEVPCERIRFIDRDGYACHPGVYSLTTADRRMIYAWMAKRQKEGKHE